MTIMMNQKSKFLQFLQFKFLYFGGYILGFTQRRDLKNG